MAADSEPGAEPLVSSAVPRVGDGHAGAAGQRRDQLGDVQRVARRAVGEPQQLVVGRAADQAATSSATAASVSPVSCSRARVADRPAQRQQVIPLRHRAHRPDQQQRQLPRRASPAGPTARRWPGRPTADRR